MRTQTVIKFEGISAISAPYAEHDVDPNSAIGALQYTDWANVS